MISYEIYKILHIYAVVVMILSLAINLVVPEKIKFFSILSGFFTFLVLVGGFGLMARIGIKHGQMFPLWITIKMLVWSIIGIGTPIAIKRFVPARKLIVLKIVMMLSLISIIMAVYKPGGV